MLKRHGHLFATLAVACDALATVGAWMACYVVRFHLGLFPLAEAAPPAVEFLGVLPIVIAGNILGGLSVGVYKPTGPRSFPHEHIRTAQAALVGWLGMVAGLYYYRSWPYARVMIGLYLLVNPMGLLASRALVHRTLRLLRSRGLPLQRAAIIGTGRLGREVLEKIRRSRWLGVRVDYFVAADESGQGALDGVPVRGRRSGLLQCLKDNPVDMVFVAVPAERSQELEGILDALAELSLGVTVIPDFTRVVTVKPVMFELDGLAMIQLRSFPIEGWAAVAKRAMDITGSLALLALLGIPLAALALLVRLTSRGPILYRQERMGLGGKPFVMLKFRSMRVDAEEATGPVWARAMDARRTFVGALMRRASLDELPQLINVLRGDMSLVGPRPERPHFIRQFVGDLPAYMLRHNVKAGITGWAQVNGLRGNTSLPKRLEYDLYYLNHWSLAFDLLILLMTPFAAFIHKHAY